MWAGSVLLASDLGRVTTPLCQVPPATHIPCCPCLLVLFSPLIGLVFYKHFISLNCCGCSCTTQMCSHCLSVPSTRFVSPCGFAWRSTNPLSLLPFSARAATSFWAGSAVLNKSFYQDVELVPLAAGGDLEVTFISLGIVWM